jgi:HprK-related kinase A
MRLPLDPVVDTAPRPSHRGEAATTLAGLGRAGVRSALAGPGLALRIAPVTVRVHSPLRDLADQIGLLYADYEVRDATAYADIDVRLLPARGIRRRLRPIVNFIVDGVQPFEPFPVGHALPMFEWGVNWVFGQRMHRYLLLHAAVVARGERAVLLPAWPGSGKSTLAASLAVRGWRYLSDEFGVVDPADATVRAFARPAALKNESIAVMRAFAPDAVMGPVFSGTRKGDVAHLRVPRDSVRQSERRLRVAAVVFPDFTAGAGVSLKPLGTANAFLKLAHNAFNYEETGEAGFRAVAAIVRSAPSRILTYGNLDDAHSALDDLLEGRA